MKTIRTMVATLLLCILVSPISALASGGTIDSLATTISDGTVTVSGSTTGVLACAICVYDETGTTLKSMETCQVKSDSTYSYTLQEDLSAGKYMITVANYDGGTAASKIITIGNGTTAAKAVGTPKTGDNIKLIFLIESMVVAMIGIEAISIYRK